MALGLDGATTPPIQRQIDEAVKRAGGRRPGAVEIENVKISYEKLRDMGALVENCYDMETFKLKKIC